MYRWYDGSWLNTNNWSNIALNPLNEKLKSAANSQAVAMKNGYGSRTVDTKDNPSASEKARQEKNKRLTKRDYNILSSVLLFCM